jgi:hypothetical protein
VVRPLLATKPLWGVGGWLKDAGRGPQKTIAKIAEIAKIARILKVQNLTADQRGLTRIRQIKKSLYWRT